MEMLLIRAYKIQLFNSMQREIQSKILDNHTTQLQTKVKENKVGKNVKKSRKD